jgi:hypothetical protein
MKQQSLASQPVSEKYGRKSRREPFLDEMEKVVPWAGLEALVRPPYAKAGEGRRPVGLSFVLRVYFVQHRFKQRILGLLVLFHWVSPRCHKVGIFRDSRHVKVVPIGESRTPLSGARFLTRLAQGNAYGSRSSRRRS